LSFNDAIVYFKFKDGEDIGHRASLKVNKHLIEHTALFYRNFSFVDDRSYRGSSSYCDRYRELISMSKYAVVFK
jgi:hypothetical protein